MADSQDLYVNSSSRLIRANRPSPLSLSGVASGHYYDIHSGTVKQGSIPPTSQSPQYDKPGCLPGAHPDEVICNDGVHVKPGKEPWDK